MDGPPTEIPQQNELSDFELTDFDPFVGLMQDPVNDVVIKIGAALRLR